MKLPKLFFRPSLNDLHDPYLMKDMDVAVSRIEAALVKTKIYWCSGITMLMEHLLLP